MVSASFEQTSFLGGEWGDSAQGRTTDPNYKRALAKSLNGMPVETGAWTRRPGLRMLGLTRHGQTGKLFPFDFSTVQPYQVVLTDGYLRMFAGLAPVIADDADGYAILNVSTATPAVVTTAGIPAGWADGDTVIFDLVSTPCSAPALCGREFTIKSVDTGAGTFALYDPITDAAIDGSVIAYVPPADGVYNDVVKKIFEIATPWTGTQWRDVRVTNNGTQVTFWHPSHQPQSLSLGTNEPFVLAAQAFVDGPYQDINTTDTTLTPSATTGTITMTASSTTGINGGDGFKSTDVGRHLRFQSAPAAWDAGTTYAKAAQVEGSDNNLYQAVTGSTGIDPTTDNGTHWIIVSAAATWVWMIIQTVVSSTEITATVQGASDLSQQSPVILGNTLSSVSPQRIWQLGFFSNTDGWPSVAAYHASRLWLGNKITANRYDGSCDDGTFFNFAPTALDGTVSDANGIADVIQTEEVDAVFWFLSTADGLLIGTQGSEHRIRASVLDDPLAPANQQERRVSKFGSKNVEAVLPWGRPIMVQRQGRKLLSLRGATDQAYDGDHISRLAPQIVSRGIDEIRWQQEPALTLWLRLSDGGLAGCVYRSSAYSFSYSQSLNINDVNFEGFFPIEHAYGRTFESISTGPSYDGGSSALYAITNQTDPNAPDYNVRHVEYLMPLFDDAVEDWGAFFVDGGASPCCGREFLVSNGDSFDGVRLYGLTYLNGLTTSVVIGGLDIGDFAVSNGYIDIPFGTPAAFTQAFFEGLSDGTDYGAFETDATFVQTNQGTLVHPADSIGMFDDVGQTEYAYVVPEPSVSKLHKLGDTGGLVTYDMDTFNVIQTKTTTDLNLLPCDAGSTVMIANGWIIGNTQISNHSQKFRVTIADGTRVTYGQNSSNAGLSGSNAADDYAMRTSAQIELLQIGSEYYTAHVNGLSSNNELAIMEMASFTLVIPSVQLIDESDAQICVGPRGKGFASIFATGGTALFGPGDTIGLYWYITDGSGLTRNKLADLAVADIDATWTTFGTVSAPYYVAKNNTFIFGVATGNSVTNKQYVVCYDPIAKAIKWTSPFTQLADCIPALYGTVEGDFFIYADVGTNPTFHKISLADGSRVSSYTFQATILATTGFGFRAKDGSVYTKNLSVSWGTDPTFLGDFAQADGHNPPRGTPASLYIGVDGDGTTTTTVYQVPTSIGLTYTSRGKLLPPNAGYDAGARNGPAFGKKRRLHWYAAKLLRTAGISFGTDFSVLKPAPMASDSGTPVAAPALFSDTLSTTIDNDYSFKGQIAWEITRPVPATIVQLGGYIETQDK